MDAMWDPPGIFLPLMDDPCGGELFASDIDNKLERGFTY